MKTVQVEDHQEALDVLLQHNSFAESLTGIEDEVVRVYAMQIAVLRLVEKLVRGENPTADLAEARQVIAEVDGQMGDLADELPRMKHYGARELSEELDTLRNLVAQANTED